MLNANVKIQAPENASKPQPLQIKKVKFNGLKAMPTDLGMESPAQFVFLLLIDCFAAQKFVAEGLLEDIFFGFENAKIPREVTCAGLLELKHKRYIYFSDSTGTLLTDDALAQAGKPGIWLRYTSKFLSLLKDDQC